MKSIDDLLMYLEEKERRIGKYRAVENPMFDKITNRVSPVIIYGAGALGHSVYDVLRKHNVYPSLFCSGLSSGYTDLLTGIRVIHKSELKEYTDGVVILSIGDTATWKEKEQIKKDILSMGYREDQIISNCALEEKVSPSFLLEHKQEITRTYNLLYDGQSREVYLRKLKYMVEYAPVDFASTHSMYVDTDIIRLEDGEVIIDAGAYDGDTALLFKDKAGMTAEIYSFEPDSYNYNRLTERVNGDGRICTEMLGLWKCKDTLLFSDDRNGSSHVEEQGINKIRVTDLDSYCLEKNIVPTYIKMDIEGTEAEALLGARDIIKRDKPKLAICLYHKPEDIFTLPLLVHKMNSEYKMYIRHYSDSRTDTLLYAV